MLNKFLLILLICYFSIGQSAQGQQRTTTKLNRHFIEIEENDTENHQYNKLETMTKTGETVTWIFDLQNRMVKQSKKGINPEGNYNQQITETFDSTNRLISQSIINLDNSKYITSHYKDGVKKGQVIHHGNDVFEIWRNNPDSVYTSNHNDFGPGIDKSAWYSFLSNNLNYPTDARRIHAEGSAIIALLVDENGDVIETEIANPDFIHPSLAKEALRVVRLFKGKFSPAISIDGQAVAQWMNIPVRFKLG